MKLFDKLKKKATTLKTETVAIYLCFKDHRTPLLAKILIVLTISYALSPIDLIPDFIPILGYLDDMVILPLMISVSIKLIPKEVLTEYRKEAQENSKINKKWGKFSAITIVLIWLLLITFVITTIFYSE